MKLFSLHWTQTVCHWQVSMSLWVRVAHVSRTLRHVAVWDNALKIRRNSHKLKCFIGYFYTQKAALILIAMLIWHFIGKYTSWPERVSFQWGIKHKSLCCFRKIIDDIVNMMRWGLKSHWVTILHWLFFYNSTLKCFILLLSQQIATDYNL